MTLELKDILAWGTALLGIVGQYFHLKGRIGILEARHDDHRAMIQTTLDKIDRKLDGIDRKLDGKADK